MEIDTSEYLRDVHDQNQRDTSPQQSEHHQAEYQQPVYHSTLHTDYGLSQIKNLPRLTLGQQPAQQSQPAAIPTQPDYFVPRVPRKSLLSQSYSRAHQGFTQRYPQQRQEQSKVEQSYTQRYLQQHQERSRAHPFEQYSRTPAPASVPQPQVQSIAHQFAQYVRTPAAAVPALTPVPESPIEPSRSLKRSYTEFRAASPEEDLAAPTPAGTLRQRMNQYRTSPPTRTVLPRLLSPTPPRARIGGPRRRSSTPQPILAEQPRRISGMCTSIYTTAASIVTFIWGLFTTKPRQPQQQEAQIEAVVTNRSGRKRRAVDITPEETIETLPGYWPKMDEITPNTQQATGGLPSPPESRPGSAHSEEITAVPQPATSSDAAAVQQSSPVSQSVSSSPKDTISSEPTSDSSPLVETAKPAKTALPKPTSATLRAAGLASSSTGESCLDRMARIRANIKAEDERKEQLRLRAAALSKSPKDMEVDELIAKAKRTSLYSKPIPQLRPYGLQELQQPRKPTWVRLREKEEQKQAEEAKAREAKLAEEARIQAEKEAEEELRIQIEREQEEARIKAEREAEEARKQAEAREKHLIRPVSEQTAHQIEKELQHKDKYRPIVKSLGGYELTRESFGRIVTSGDAKGTSSWLDDPCMNGWVEAIVQKKKDLTGYKKGPNNVPAFEFIGCEWYPAYKRAGNSMTGLKNWTKRKGIQGAKLLKAEKVFMPTNSGAHWTMIIVSPKDRTIQYLDSYNSRLSKNGKYFLRLARDWLEFELGALYKADEWAELDNVSSQQDNFDDCGVFASFNALAAATGADFEAIDASETKAAREMIAGVLLKQGFHDEFELHL